jgi:signal transduction histidine kinase
VRAGDLLEVSVILATHTSHRNRPGLLPDLLRVLRNHVRKERAPDPPTPDDALVRALCHDMGSSLATLERTLTELESERARGELLEFARAQAAHLTSMLRTADATGGAAVRRSEHTRRLRDVLACSVAGSGLPRHQLAVHLADDAGDVVVADARLQRILINLLENAHRHGGGSPVRLDVRRRHGGWVSVAVTQEGLSASRVIGHLYTERPPADLTGLGLWSVRRQAQELGGQVVWSDGGGALTLTVLLPDR